MFIIVDERDLVTNGYACRFGQEGIASTGFRPGQFRDWVTTAVEGDVQAIEAFLIGECPEREEIPRLIRRRSQAPVIAMNDAPSLEQTLGLFSAGVDDVVRKPVHVREILARVHAIRRRAEARQDWATVPENGSRLIGLVERADDLEMQIGRKDQRQRGDKHKG